MRFTQSAASVSCMTHHHTGDRTAPGHATFDVERVAAALELEGELTAGLADEAITLCADRFAAAGTTVGRVIDLGCGPGVGTALLAERFPSATVVAVDGAAAMLARAGARVARLGQASRIETLQLDLEGDLQGLGTCDLAWAAMAIHHADDEVATLRRFGEPLRPQGLLCVLERAGPMVVRLADELGRPGIWDRLEAARSEWFERARPTLPGALNAERYPSMLASAGLEVLDSRTLSGTVTAPADAATRAFVQAHLRRSTRDLADMADAADLEALLAYIEAAPGGGCGAAITSTRRLFIGRRSV
jgi:trans-aconitate methyltransferase